MAYLVTGGTGFVGSYVTRDLLSEGKEVVCLQRSGVTPIFRELIGEENLDKVKIVQVDLSNTLRLFNVVREYDIDVIVHLAIISLSSGISEAQPAYAMQVNCVGTNNVLEAARLFSLRRVVWTSSGQALGRVGEYHKETVGDDDALYMPSTMYGASKAFDEFMSRHYFDKFGVDSIGLRMGLTLGYGRLLGREGIFTKFLQDVAAGVPATMTTMDADRVRSFSYVDNISDLIVKACEAPTTKTRTFNAVEYQCSVRQLVEAMCKVNPEAQVTIKEGVAPEVATLGGSPEPMLDITGVETELGWKPKYSLEEAVKRLFNYFREQKGLPPL
jgi:UDP-glucose 4-epimerase